MSGILMDITQLENLKQMLNLMFRLVAASAIIPRKNEVTQKRARRCCLVFVTHCIVLVIGVWHLKILNHCFKL